MIASHEAFVTIYPGEPRFPSEAEMREVIDYHEAAAAGWNDSPKAAAIKARHHRLAAICRQALSAGAPEERGAP